MKKFISISVIFFFASLSAAAQDLKVKIYDPPVNINNNTEWGTDYTVADSEPFGRPSGAYRNGNSTVYLSIPDTNTSRSE